MRQCMYLLLLVCLTVGSCKKKNDDPNNGGSSFNLGVDGSCGATFTFKGTNYEFQDYCPTNIGYGGIPSVMEIDFLSGVIDQSSSGWDINKINLRFGTWVGDSLPTEAQFRALFTTGSKTFTDELDNGVQVELDVDGEEYYNSHATMDQSGGTVTFDDVKFYYDEGSLYAKVDASFSCKVYDNNGDDHQITNARYVATFTNDLNL